MLKRIVVGAIVCVGAGCSDPRDEGASTPATGFASETTGAAGAAAPRSAVDTATSAAATPTTNATASAAIGGGPGGSTGVAAAAGVANDAPAAPSQTATQAEALPPATGAPISDACRGFELEGLVYSPGGDVLPNKCEAFHPTLNNPYAVRCVDAWPWWKTEFPGDSFCILPPPPDKGIQIGHHPQGEGDAWIDAVSKGDMSAYENPPQDWTLEPGGEEERNILITHSNMGGKYYRVYSRMRGGSHHMIVSTAEAANTFTWTLGSPDGLFSGTSIPGAQRPDENLPQSFSPPAEDEGLYREIPERATVQYNMHHFNSTDKRILKEAWQNLWWADKPTTLVNQINGLPLLQAVGTFAQPGEVVDMHYAIPALDELRVLGVFGHRHAWTTNFSAWVERAAGQPPEIIYQSFDWFDEPTFNYSSQIMNPQPLTATRTDGGYTGILTLQPGETLHFNCHIEYTDERAREEGSPVTPAQNGPLRFANEAYNAEMCILFGAAVGNYGSAEQQGPPPDFASAR